MYIYFKNKKNDSNLRRCHYASLAQFHSIKYDVPGIEFKTHYDRVMGQVGPAFQAMIEQIDDELGDKLNEYPLSELPKAKVIGEEEANIYKISTELGLGRIGMCVW